MTAPTSIPLVAEQLEIDKRLVDTARVHIRKRARWREHEVDVALRRDEVDIERVAVNRLVDEAVASRQEGDVTIVPIYEEVLVTRLLLKEELHIRRRIRIEPREPLNVALRHETVDVVRTPLADDKHPPHPTPEGTT